MHADTDTGESPLLLRSCSCNGDFLFFLSLRTGHEYSCLFGEPQGATVDIQWGIIEHVLWRTALQADAYVFGFIRAHLHFVPMYTGYSW